MAESLSLPASSRLYLSSRAVGLVAGLIGAIVAARLLGPEARGSLGLFVFAVAVGVAVFGLGLPTAAYDLIARRIVGGPEALAGAVVVAGLAGLAGAVALIWIELAGWTRGAFGGQPVLLVACAAGVAICGTLLVQANTMAAVALGATRVAAAGQALPVLLTAASYLVTLIALGSGLGGAMLGYGVAAVASAIVVSALGLSWSQSRPPGLPAVRTVSGLLRRGLRVAVSDIAYILSYRIDVLLLASLADLASLGRYSVGVQLVEPMAVVGTALAMSLLGVATAAPAGTLSHVVGLAARVSVLVCLLGGVVMTLGALLVGGAILGPGYASVPMVTAILVPGVAAIAVSRILSGAVIGQGGLGIGSVIASATVTVNIVLNIILVPVYSELGAALASSIAYAVSLALWLRAWRARGGNLGVTDLVPRPRDGLVLLAAMRGRPPAA